MESPTFLTISPPYHYSSPKKVQLRENEKETIHEEEKGLQITYEKLISKTSSRRSRKHEMDEQIEDVISHNPFDRLSNEAEQFYSSSHDYPPTFESE